jgi:hypothetical protein
MCTNCSLDLPSSTSSTNTPCTCENYRTMDTLLVPTIPMRQIAGQTYFSMGLSDNTSGTPAPSPTPVRRKRLILADFYLSDEEVLIQFQERLEGFRAQRAIYKQELRNRSSHSLHYRHYSDRLERLRNAIASLKHDIRIYQIRVYGYAPPTSTRSGRNVIPVARYQNEVFIPGSNNRHTKGRRIDVGKSTER